MHEAKKDAKRFEVFACSSCGDATILPFGTDRAHDADGGPCRDRCGGSLVAIGLLSGDEGEAPFTLYE